MSTFLARITHTIHMPDKSQYDTAEAYYNDIFHEIGHSTCKELDRIPKMYEHEYRLNLNLFCKQNHVMILAVVMGNMSI